MMCKLNLNKVVYISHSVRQQKEMVVVDYLKALDFPNE